MDALTFQILLVGVSRSIHLLYAIVLLTERLI